MSLLPAQPAEAGRPPRSVCDNLWLFPPNRDSQGGSSWWLERSFHWQGAPCSGVLIDCPAVNETSLNVLRQRGPGVIVLTSREGHGRLRRLQELLDWPVLVQEQEAYLLPGVQALRPFASACALAPGLELRWTPGPTPGAAVLLSWSDGPAVVFCGRLLSPVAPERAAPLRTRRSFHWGRWLRSLEALRDQWPLQEPMALASGAGLGALRGAALIPDALAQLQALDFEALRAMSPP